MTQDLTQQAHQALIEARNVTKSFNTSAGVVEVLHKADFTIDKGSFTIIYGASGSGKSTLLNMLMGLDAPSTGQIMYDGTDIYSQGSDALASFRANSRGIVQQTNYWVKSLKVIENVSMPLYFSGMSRAESDRQAHQALEQVGMDHKANSFPYVLSGGEQQRVAMARALVHNPAYMLADEPTGNLDSTNGDLIINLLKDFHEKQGRTIVLVTHNLEYLPLATKLVMIQDGTITSVEGSDSREFIHQLIDRMKNRIDNWSETSKESHHA